MSMTKVERALERTTDTKDLLIGAGVVSRTGEMFTKLFPGCKAIIVADLNTWEVAGKAVYASLVEAGIEQDEPFIFIDKELYAEWKHVEALKARLEKTEAIAIAVGSGVMNDTTKYVSHLISRKYMCVGTAASMDGYTAYGSSITKDGNKQTFDCPAPYGFVMDPVIAAAAPKELAASGYADLIAKIPAAADWMLADVTGNEKIDEFALGLVQDGLRESLSAPAAVREGDLKMTELLSEGLLMSGFAMQAHRSSRPASGAEHLFARLWEMEHRLFGDNVPSHGFMVAIGLLCSTALFECLLKEDIEALDIEAAVAAWPTAEEARLDALVTFEGTDFPLIGVKETAAKYINKRELRNQLKTLKANWSEIRTAVENQIFTYEECRSLLAAVGAPTEPEEIGISRSRLKDSVMKAVKIRRRFTILDLGLRCGLLDRWTDELFGAGGRWDIKE